MSDNNKNRSTGHKPEQVVRSKNKKNINNIAEFTSGKAVIIREDSLIMQSSIVQLFLFDLYNFLYAIGISVLRNLNRYKRETVGFYTKLEKTLSKIFRRLKALTGSSFRVLIRNIKTPFIEIRESWRSEALNRQIAKENRKFPWSSMGRVSKQAVIHLWSILSTVLNYMAPVVALIVFVTIVRHQLSIQYALDVTYKGEKLGIIKNEREFGEALKEVDGRLVGDLETNYTSGAPFFQIVEVPSGKNFTDAKDLVNGIIRASSEDVVEAYGLYANDRLVGAVVNEKPIINEIDRIQEENKSGKPGERIEFEKSIAFKGGLYPSETIVTEQELIDKINSTETSDEMYTVVEGDTPASVALKMGITLSVLQEINPTMQEELEVGSTLFISKARRFLSIKTIYTDVYPVEIDYTIIKTENPLYAKGYYKVESPGVKGIGMTTAEITTVDGMEISRVILDVKRVSEPVSELVTVGVDVHPLKDEAGFKWPGNGGFIGTGVGGYPGHVGVDINQTGGIGSPIFAAASGTVITSTYSYGGYGKYVVIQHKDGFTTLYAHCSELYVNVGDPVAKGQIIAAVGVTGNTSGPHLHFEMKQNGQLLNPSSFIGTSG